MIIRVQLLRKKLAVFQFHCFSCISLCSTVSFFCQRHLQKIQSLGLRVCFSFTVSAVVLQFGRCQLTKVFPANRETQNISYCTHPPFVPCRHTIKCETINLKNYHKEIKIIIENNFILPPPTLSALPRYTIKCKENINKNKKMKIMIKKIISHRTDSPLHNEI